MNLELVTRDDFENRTLAHYRTEGSKNGVRLYQNKDGSLTPLGRIHYGIGKAKDAASAEIKDHVKIVTSTSNVDKTAAKAELNEHRAERAKEKSGSDSVTKFDYRATKLREKEQAMRDKEAKRDRSTSEIKKDVDESVQKFNDTVKALKEEHEKSNGKESLAQEKKSRQQEEKDIRILTDAELDKRISRLQKEKQYSELLNERRQREKGPVEQAASKYFREFAEKLARKSLDKLADKLLQKAFSGKSNNNNNNGNNNKSNNSSNNKSDSNSSGGNGQKFSKAEKSQIRSMAGAGKSVADIAQALGTTEDKVKSYMSAAGVTIS